MTSIGDPLVGHLLDGRYQITQRLARGGMATVYQAVDQRLGRTVAVKVMHMGLGDDADFSRKFDREARAAARLSHPNVVSVFDQGHDGGRAYIVMEYVAGQTLRSVISNRAPLEPLAALELIEPVLSALAHAHAAGLVHRDVKPENVLISDRGQLKVADFGLAKAITAQTSTATQGLLIGTVSYLPPELVISGKADARSDVYSTGVVLFELLTGRKPHTGETPIQVAYAHVHNDVPPPSSMPTAGPIPPYLDALLACVTARDPNARPHDARVMLTHLRRVKAALRDGLVDDPELTQDLTIPLQGAGGDFGDRADFEATTLVAPGSAAPGPTPIIVPRSPRTPTDPSWSHPIAVRPYANAPVPPPAQPDQAMLVRQAQQRQRQRRQRRRGWIALFLVLILTAIAAATGWYFTNGRFTTAPPLTSMSQDEAMTSARTAGLYVTFSADFSETVPSGKVISTDPAAGSEILRGGEMTAVISKGPERFPAPKLIGLSEAAAKAALTEANLAVGKIALRFHEKVAKDTVINASEDQGAKLKKNTRVDLVVSKGPEPIKIKNYVKKSAKDAKSQLMKAGFTVTTTTNHSDKIAAGLVISQTPNEGSGMRGDKIELVESLGPELVVVPFVKAMGVKAATETLQSKGFKVKTARSSALYLGVGFVASTDPKAGTKAPKGSTITLYLV